MSRSPWRASRGNDDGRHETPGAAPLGAMSGDEPPDAAPPGARGFAGLAPFPRLARHGLQDITAPRLKRPAFGDECTAEG